MELTISVKVSGDYTEEELKQYLLFCMGVGCCPYENPFINEDSETEIQDVDFV